MPSSPFVRALRTTIVFLLVLQLGALAAMGTGVAGSVMGTSGDASAAEGGAGAGDADGAAATEETEPPASSVSTSTTGDSPPSVEAAITGTLGNGGWYTTDVAIEWNITDADEEVTPGADCVTYNVTADTAGDSFSCTATSAGGSTATTTVVIARDANAPEGVAVSTDRGADHDGWFNAPFTATWTGSDATSGIETCTTTTYEGPDVENGTLDGSCSDEAGNTSEPVTLSFSYDATRPEVTATPDRPADHNGWYNAALTITWSSTDPSATCDAPTTYSGPDGEDLSVSGSCTDQAGNTDTATFTFDFDDTAPTIDLRTPADDAIYILRQPVAADFSCADATAQIDSCTGTVGDGAPIDTASVGEKSFRVTATDQAGNEAVATATYLVQYSPAGVKCDGVAGHQILSPIRTDGSSVHKAGSTVPAKFRVCDYFGSSVTTAGVVEDFKLIKIGSGDADQTPNSTSAHDEFRAGDAQWIFNINTKGLPASNRLGYRIALDDGTSIDFSFLLK